MFYFRTVVVVIVVCLLGAHGECVAASVKDLLFLCISFSLYCLPTIFKMKIKPNYTPPQTFVHASVKHDFTIE